MNNTPPWYRQLDRAWDSLTKGASDAWLADLERCQAEKAVPIPSGDRLMEKFCVAIAHSQSAPSDVVLRMIKAGHLKEAMHDYSVAKIAVENPVQLLLRCWKKPLTCIRFKGKIKSMVECARILQDIENEHGSFAKYLRSFQVPRRVHSTADIEVFWQAFDALQQDLKRRKIPFFANTTSLLQLLIDLDHDALKPDLIIMRVAHQWGIVPWETGIPALRQAVRAFQEYGVIRKRRPLAVDWVVLTHGKQKGALAIWEGSL
jgi:3-methyladenine DNA glycosylase Tag